MPENNSVRGKEKVLLFYEKKKRASNEALRNSGSAGPPMIRKLIVELIFISILTFYFYDTLQLFITYHLNLTNLASLDFTFGVVSISYPTEVQPELFSMSLKR